MVEGLPNQVDNVVNPMTNVFLRKPGGRLGWSYYYERSESKGSGGRSCKIWANGYVLRVMYRVAIRWHWAFDTGLSIPPWSVLLPRWICFFSSEQHLSTHHCLQTQIVFNSKSAPALSTNIKLTHLINFPREFPTCIFPASRFNTTLLDWPPIKVDAFFLTPDI